MKIRVSILLFFLVHFSSAQLFDNEDRLKLVEHTVNFIYNIQEDSAAIYIDSVESLMPNHPVTPMMKAMEILWMNIPLVTIDTIFDKFKAQLQEVIKLSQRLDGGRQEHPEAIFFEMAARGLLAEYYADDDQYMHAVSEANKTYQLLKIGFKLVDDSPEFLFTSGVYNYFREKYPEKYPLYKPFVWFFRSGDKELGIVQLKQACEKAVITKVEAYVYLSFIYLRYEYQPKKAQRYLRELSVIYPNNPYIKAKLLESLADGKNFEEADSLLVSELLAIDRPYYQLAGNAFMGLYYEKVHKSQGSAMVYYQKGIEAGNEIKGHGSYYRCLAQLGLGRIYLAEGKDGQAKFQLNQAMENAPTQAIKEEAEELLDQL